MVGVQGQYRTGIKAENKIVDAQKIPKSRFRGRAQQHQCDKGWESWEDGLVAGFPPLQPPGESSKVTLAYKVRTWLERSGAAAKQLRGKGWELQS